LYPASSPGERDAFSPAAYKNLQTNATGLLLRLQSAYRERTVALQEVRAERDAQHEEMDETKLRIELFKTQLEDMAAKATEHEKAMQSLVAELHAEKRARHEEHVARDKMLAEGSMVSEDLCVDEEDRKRWRTSISTAKSDLSIDTTYAESTESESVFSRSRSPTIMTSATESEGAEPALRGVPPRHIQEGATRNMSEAKSPAQLTTFQKLVKGMSRDSTSREQDEQMGQDGCNNCHGQDASVAWDTVGLLRDENKGLKHRVAQLEVAVEGALDMVNGIGA
jgi:hypothetical protein